MNETKNVQEVEQRTSALARDTAARGAEQIREKVDVRGSTQAVSRALRRAADSLREDGYQRAASMTEQAAGRCEGFGAKAQGKDPGAMIRDVQQFAQSNPALFIAGCTAVGFVLARLLSTSAPSSQREPAFERYGEGTNVPVAPPVYGEPVGEIPPGGL